MVGLPRNGCRWVDARSLGVVGFVGPLWEPQQEGGSGARAGAWWRGGAGADCDAPCCAGLGWAVTSSSPTPLDHWQCVGPCNLTTTTTYTRTLSLILSRIVSRISHAPSLTQPLSHAPSPAPHDAGSGPEAAHTGSAAEVFRMASEALDALYGMDVPMPPGVQEALMEAVDGVLKKWGVAGWWWRWWGLHS